MGDGNKSISMGPNSSNCVLCTLNICSLLYVNYTDKPVNILKKVNIGTIFLKKIHMTSVITLYLETIIRWELTTDHYSSVT